ncbi:MAG: hypothetical protein QM706_00755 [Nitrospira sp.]
MVDELRLGVGDLRGELVELDVVGMHSLISPKVIRLSRASPRISNIECDQKMRPRARSQSHSPQRPRLSAVSMRLRTVS